MSKFWAPSTNGLSDPAIAEIVGPKPLNRARARAAIPGPDARNFKNGLGPGVVKIFRTECRKHFARAQIRLKADRLQIHTRARIKVG